MPHPPPPCDHPSPACPRRRTARRLPLGHPCSPIVSDCVCCPGRADSHPQQSSSLLHTPLKHHNEIAS
eukprot:2545478-Pyramimonas_sp.AAC.1